MGGNWGGTGSRGRGNYNQGILNEEGRAAFNKRGWVMLIMAEMRKRLEVELKTWLAQRWLQCGKTLVVLQPSWQHSNNTCTFSTKGYLHTAATVTAFKRES